MNQVSIVMPFVHRKSTKDAHLSDIENSRLQQTYAWSKFNNRRNTTRIQHYFQLLHDKRIMITYNLAAIILCIISIWVEILLIGQYYDQSYQNHSNSIMDIFYATLYEHTIHTLRDPTFFSDFFPSYFTNPYKFPLSLETAPIYVQSFLIAYQCSAGYVTSWKVGDINGKLIEIDSNENELNKSYLIFCNGTNYPTYYWNSLVTEYNHTYPFEGGNEISMGSVLKTDWFVAGYNASGPLISELFIKRIDDTFIPQYTLVFPAIDTITSATDFVFSFDLTLQKVQHFLRTLNVTVYSRLAVTTNEGVLIAVTGDDQPIDAFNNEIVTKEIGELSDQVWLCVSKDEAFIRKENFSIECNILLSEDDEGIYDTSNGRNASIAYNVFIASVPIGKVTNWQFIAVIENTLQNEVPHTANILITNTKKLRWKRDFLRPFIIGIVISVVGWFILIVLYQFTPYILRALDKKNKSRNKYQKLGKQKSKSTPNKIKMDILHLFGWRCSNHAKPIGLMNAISNLKIIQDFYTENENAEIISKKVIFEIRENSFGSPTFNDTELYSKVENISVRNKLKQIFGCNDYREENDEDDFNLDDSEIMKRRRSSFSSQHPAFDASSLSIISNSQPPSRINLTSINTKNSDESEKLEDDEFKTHNSDNDDENNENNDNLESIQKVVSIISCCNDYFNEYNFNNLAEKILVGIPNEFLFITTNSFLFIDDLLKLQFQLASMLFDSDMRLAFFIAELSFQDAMKERRNRNDDNHNSFDSKLMNQLFLYDDKSVIKSARLILCDLFESRSRPEHYHDNLESTTKDIVISINNYSNNINATNKDNEEEDNNSETTENYSDSHNINLNYRNRNHINTNANDIDDLRWTKICEYTFEILQSTPLSSHIEIITKSQLFLTSKLTETKLTKIESMLLLKLLYISSMASFLFDEKDSQIGCTALGINENDEEEGEIMNCLYENLIYPEMSALNQIFGSKYIFYTRKH